MKACVATLRRWVCCWRRGGYPITPADLWAASGAEPEELSAQGPPHAPSAPKGIHHLQAADPAPMAEIRCRRRLPHGRAA